MATRSRILLALAASMLGLAFVLPLWRVSLEAPQYPGGIGMQIWIDTIDGVNPHDLQNINGLNHYIGMKTIEPDSIPELNIMPWLFGVLIGLGLLAAAAGKRWMLYSWTAAFGVLLAVGFVDYYMWGYDYGHNLSPDAAIKIPGMAYQPPLIGSRNMLNFVAHSWPDTGGLVIFVSMILGLSICVLERRRRRTARVTEAGASAGLAVASVLAIGMMAGCEPEPQPLLIGEMTCTHCRMTVSDARYGAELVASTGKVYPFDAIECLTAYLKENPEAQESAHSLWVASFDEPGSLITTSDAFLLQSDAIQSPMGGGLAAFTTADARDEALSDWGGSALDWGGVLALTEIDVTVSHAAHAH